MTHETLPIYIVWTMQQQSLNLLRPTAWEVQLQENTLFEVDLTFGSMSHEFIKKKKKKIKP